MNLLSKAKTVLKPVTTKVAKIATKVNVNSPQLLIFGGLAVMTAGAVYACTKTEKIKDDAKSIQTNFDAAEGKKEKVKAVAKGIGNVAKDCAGPVIVYGAGVAMVLAGKGKLDKKVAALGGLVVAAENKYKEFFARVSDEYGEENANRLASGTQQMVYERAVKDDDGKIKTKKDLVEVLPEGVEGFSRYSFSFEECRVKRGVWSEDPWRIKMHLIHSQAMCNQRLREKGYLFLNEALDIYGLANKCKDGQLVGWIYSDKSKILGDHAVDCGVYLNDQCSRRHINYLPHILFLEGKENSVLLDFNCDGYILDECVRLNLF